MAMNSMQTLACVALLSCVTAHCQSAVVDAADFASGQQWESKGEYPLAFLSYKRAADAGNADACIRIAKMYDAGKLGQSSPSPAAKYQQSLPWYKLAASAGNKEAQQHLSDGIDGDDFRTGKSFEARGEYSTAFLAYKNAGDAGNGDAYLQIAKLYSSGKIGTPLLRPDQIERQSLYWYEQAASAGSKEAREYLRTRNVAISQSQEGAQSSTRSMTCQSTLAYLADTIPTTNSSRLNSLRSQLLASDMREVMRGMAAQHMSYDEAIRLAGLQADADSANLPQLESTIRASAQPGTADALISALRARQYAQVPFSDDVLGAAESSFVANDWGELANRETAKQLRCFASGSH